MYMLKTSFLLTDKRLLTSDVWELHYSYEWSVDILPGQYVMFQLAPGLNRAYSFAWFSENTFMLIIECIPEWRGSPMICHADIGTKFDGMLGLGHFTLKNTPANKCFIGTGTGFAPLYCQLVNSIELGLEGKKSFIFWVRKEENAFYQEEMKKIMEVHPAVQFFPYLSREEKAWFSQWYVTDWLTEETVHEYEEFYICGSPEVVTSVREKLASFGIPKEQIFFEQY